jgi:hypothetical protein
MIDPDIPVSRAASGFDTPYTDYREQGLRFGARGFAGKIRRQGRHHQHRQGSQKKLCMHQFLTNKSVLERTLYGRFVIYCYQAS